MKLLDKNNKLQNIVPIFLDNYTNANYIDEAGQLFITTLYAAQCVETSLDKLRYNLFAKSLMKKGFKLVSLLPTQLAARQHSLQTYHLYHQIQIWIGNEKNSLDWE